MTPKPITAVSNRSTTRYSIGSYRRFDRYNRSIVNRIEDLFFFALISSHQAGKGNFDPLINFLILPGLLFSLFMVSVAVDFRSSMSVGQKFGSS